MSAYYNERDAFSAAWLRELIAAGVIAAGVVDERPIQEVKASDVEGFTQAHFFAGIGVWSYALRLAGYPDDRPVWTGSCPCQPFSAAGARRGFDDERHLWPTWFALIGQCRPLVVFGEQVSSDDGLAWVEAVQADMEGQAYAFGAADTCAAGFGAPHRRQRLYFVADSGSDGLRSQNAGHDAGGYGRPFIDAAVDRCVGGLGDSSSDRDREHARELRRHEAEYEKRPTDGRDAPVATSATRCVADDDVSGCGEFRAPRLHADGQSRDDATGRGEIGGPALGDADREGLQARTAEDTAGARRGDIGRAAIESSRSPTRGFWRAAEWIPCRDGRARPVEPGSFPLAHGASARVGRLRGYGNALCAPQAQQFKPVSTRELQAWVDKHVRFETDDNTAELFPETAAVISQATEKAEKVVSITFDGFVQPEAREGERIYGPKSWKRADGKSGSKECELSVIGVVAAGAGRGEAFRVCIEKKKCAPHWASEQRAAKKRKTETAAAGTTGESRYDAARKKDEEDRQKAERLRQRWLKALPAILRAVADTLKRTPAKSISQLGEMLAVMCKPYSMKPDDVKGYVPRGATAEDLVRHCGFLLLAGEAMEYRAPEEFPKRAKAFGIDVVKILDTVAPEEKATEQPKAESAPEAKAATKKPTPTPAAKKTAGPIARKAKKK